MEIGDKVIVNNGYSFDGEVGIVIGFLGDDQDWPIVEVPTDEYPRDVDKQGWALRPNGWKPYSEEGQVTP
jgi:hypothetical protein